MPNIQSYLNDILAAVYGEEVRGSIHDAIEAINNNVDSSDQANLMNSIAPTYDTLSTSTIYNVGDLVFRADGSGRLYMCQTATTGGITFSGSNWVEVPIGNLIRDYVEVNQFRFDSSTSIPIIQGKTCDELTKSNVWYVWCRAGEPVVTDFPISGPGWLRVSATGARIVQQVYPSNLLKFPYRLIRTKDGRDSSGNSSSSNAQWSDWYKIPLAGKDWDAFGDIVDLKESLFKTEYSDLNSITDGFYTLYAGGLTSTGRYLNNGKYCRTRTIACEESLRIAFNNSDYLVKIWGYIHDNVDEAGTKAYAIDESSDSFIVTPTSTTHYIRISFGRKDGAILTNGVDDPTSDYYKIRHSLKIYTFSGGSANITVDGTSLVIT